MTRLHGTSAAVRIAVNQIVRDLPAMYVQAGITGVLIGTILGLLMGQLRSRGVVWPGGLGR